MYRSFHHVAFVCKQTIKYVHKILMVLSKMRNGHCCEKIEILVSEIREDVGCSSNVLKKDRDKCVSFKENMVYVFHHQDTKRKQFLSFHDYSTIQTHNASTSPPPKKKIIIINKKQGLQEK